MIIRLKSHIVKHGIEDYETEIVDGDIIHINTNFVESVTEKYITIYEHKEYTETRRTLFGKTVEQKIGDKWVPKEPRKLYLTKFASGQKHYFTENVLNYEKL